VENAFVGARGVDSLPFSQAGTKAQAEAREAFDGAADELARVGRVADAARFFAVVFFFGDRESFGAPPFTVFVFAFVVFFFAAMGIPSGLGFVSHVA
jgi:hypothetical protein